MDMMKRLNRILVVGDAMLDTYIYGTVNRVSPEAPVPVVQSSREEHLLGGAANVARNAAALGAEVTVLFVIGTDALGTTMCGLLTEAGINCSFLIRDGELQTINKMRIVGNRQQIARIDFHDGYSLSPMQEKQVLDEFGAAAEERDIVVLSDYGKGLCTDTVCREIIAFCREKRIPVIVDPKGTQWKKYHGASVITPNLKEINTYSGKNIPNQSAAIEEAYDGFNRELGIDYLLLTRSECGMSLMGDGKALHIPAKAQEVYDVSGAGDTVVAALASLLEPEMENISEAVKMANTAAGIVVAKTGTAVVTMAEIQGKLLHENTENSERKIFRLNDYDRLEQTLSSWRAAGERIVTTNGCFDILHRGHVKLLEEARELGDRLVVAINSDASVRRLKGDLRPINREQDRAYVLSSLQAVDAVVIFDPQKTPYILSEKEKRGLGSAALRAAAEAPMALMRLIHSDIHAKGGDYSKEDIPEAIFSSEVELIPFADGYSTTNVLNSMRNK